MSLLLPLLIPFAAAIVALGFHGRIALQRWLAVVGTLLSTITGMALVLEVDATGLQVLHVGGWAAPHGITLVADRLSAIMMAVSSLVAFAGAIYAMEEIEESMIRRHFVPLFLLLLTGVNGACITGDLFNLYVWFEVLLCSSFVLLALGCTREQLRGCLKYVVLNLFASTLFLIGVGLLYGKVGSLNMADIALKLEGIENAGITGSSGLLILLAFGVKAGIFPLFFWLPSSYPTPPFAVSAVFAGLLTKVGVYSMIHSTTLYLAPGLEAWDNLLIGAALTTMIAGVLGAVAQTGIRRILSFHIISQVGYILAGAAVMSVAGLAAAIFYLVHHIIVKANLFLVAGLIHRRHGSDTISKTGGLLQASPFITFVFFVSAFSLAGLPPLSSFWAKLGVLQAGLQAEAWLLSAGIVGVGVLTLISMLKIWIGSFWPPQEEEEEAKTLNTPAPLMWAPCALLALCTLGMGFLGAPVYDLAVRAPEDLLQPQTYIQSVLGGQP